MIPTVVVPRFQRNNLTKQLKNWVALVHPSQPQPKTCSNKLPVIFNPTIRPNLESQPLHNLDSKKVRYFSSQTQPNPRIKPTLRDKSWFR